MAIWKDYLRAVLKTRTTSAEASNASSPSESGVVTYPDNTKSIVPPADGFLRIRATGVGSGGAWLNAFQGAWGISQDNSPGLPCEVGIRVRKGAKVAISCSEGMKVEQIRLIKTIGGGYKRYLKALVCNRFGGSSWLRLKTTSETLRKQIAGSHSLQSRKSPSGKLRHRLTQDDGITYRRAMGILLCGLQELRLKPTQPRNMLSNFQQTLAAPLAARSVLVRRETLRHGVFGDQASLMEKFTSFRVWVASNNARMEVAA